MRHLLTNILLAFAWAVLAGNISTVNLLIGFALGYAILSLQQRVVGQSSYYRKGWQLFRVLCGFLKDLLLSSIEVAHEVITPGRRSGPGIIAVPLDAESDFEIMLLANRISLTPGTLSIDVSEDRKTLSVHVMFLKDAEETRRAIKQKIERPLLELTR